MLQQILADMYVDPDVLEALNDDQKKILFLKMREEQVRRWKEREEREGKEGRMEKTRTKKGPSKSVSWLLGRDGDVHVYVIGETEEFKSSKLILSELREQNRAGLNKVNRPQTTEPVKISSPSRTAQQPGPEPGIALLLKKAENTSPSAPLPGPQKQDSDSDQSLEDAKDDSDSSDSADSVSNYSSDVAVYKSHRMNSHAFVTERLNGLQLQRSAKEQLSVKETPRPQDTPTQERVVNDQMTSNSYGSRVAQLRRNFNTKPSSPYVKPPIPSKPAHLLAPAAAR
ncbi:uncharacterized protein LOC143499448 isoform X2 [Brachyhypopomus gauderio]|uniref:uncharacterized protein LOC143499448 isoform X2 n=1 Tax=Brachyhypopomus gauderio TaxID=698409 RepID=UPI0040437430